MKQAPRLCRTGCGRRVGTARSFLCCKCFLKHAVSSGSRSSGNKHPLVHTGHSGNLSSKGILGNAGNRRRGKSKIFAGQAGAYKAACKKKTLERVFERPTSRSTQKCQEEQCESKAQYKNIRKPRRKTTQAQNSNARLRLSPVLILTARCRRAGVVLQSRVPDNAVLSAEASHESFAPRPTQYRPR